MARFMIVLGNPRLLPQLPGLQPHSPNAIHVEEEAMARQPQQPQRLGLTVFIGFEINSSLSFSSDFDFHFQSLTFDTIPKWNGIAQCVRYCDLLPKMVKMGQFGLEFQVTFSNQSKTDQNWSKIGLESNQFGLTSIKIGLDLIRIGLKLTLICTQLIGRNWAKIPHCVLEHVNKGKEKEKEKNAILQVSASITRFTVFVFSWKW